jgi:hypothetical protein
MIEYQTYKVRKLTYTAGKPRLNLTRNNFFPSSSFTVSSFAFTFQIIVSFPPFVVHKQLIELHVYPSGITILNIELPSV